MQRYASRTVHSLQPNKHYLSSRQALVDWLSGVGDSLNISNQAVHHAVLVLDVFSSRVGKDFDIVLAALCSLLASAKFVQMKYPSADSLNSATNNQYEFDDFIDMEGHILRVIDWQLLQYPVYDFVNLFLAHGCLFESDKILQSDGRPDLRPTSSSATNLRKYAEFFTDFCIQETQLIKSEPLSLSSAIIAVTRKHMNLETVWTEEMFLLTTMKLVQFKDLFLYIDQRYTKNFPDSVASQIRVTGGR